jgi:hypothetical protein
LLLPAVLREDGLLSAFMIRVIINHMEKKVSAFCGATRNLYFDHVLIAPALTFVKILCSRRLIFFLKCAARIDELTFNYKIAP